MHPLDDFRDVARLGSSGTLSDRRSPPSVGRLRLQLKVAMRTSPGGRGAAVAGMMPATRVKNATTLRTSPRAIRS